MNAILRTSVAVWSIVFVATTLPASLLSATPLHFQIDMVVRHDAFSTPLDNATLKLDLTWDAWTVAPLFPSGGAWPTSNTTGSLTVSGSAAVDGVYSPQFPSMSQWLIVDGAPTRDSINLPSMRFAIGGQTFDFESFRFRFEGTFFERIPLSPLYPKPFESTEAQWDLRDTISFYTPSRSGSAQPLSISARYVPEPSALALGSVAIISIAALRRRK